MLEIGPNLLTLLMALIPSVAILAAAIAAYIHTKTVDQIRRVTQDTNEKVSQVQRTLNGSTADRPTEQGGNRG